jgi:hypothetical protein
VTIGKAHIKLDKSGPPGQKNEVVIDVKNVDQLVNEQSQTVVRVEGTFNHEWSMGDKLPGEIMGTLGSTVIQSNGPMQISVLPKNDPLDLVTNPDGSQSWKEYETEPGVIKLRTVYASAWAEVERNNCFCCSCPANNPDPHCRNHGWAGRRPCEDHKLPGTKYEQEHIDNKTGSLLRVDVMPQSVQAYRREQGN